MSTQALTIGEVVRKASEDARVKAAAMKAAANPANEQEHKVTLKAVRFDDHGDYGVIVGIGGSIGKDKENDEVAKAALIGMAYDFCVSKAQIFCANHDETIPISANLVENWVGAPILKSGKLLAPGADVPADDPMVGINFEKGNETHWFFGMRPSDPKILDAARKGEIVGFSWAGRAQKEVD